MEHLEGRTSVLAALEAGRRKFREILISKSARPDKFGAVLDAAARRGVPVRRVSPEEVERLAHGKTHGGVVAICSARPLEKPEDLIPLVRGLSEPPLFLLLDGVDDPRHLGQTMRSAEALGAHAVLVRRRAWDFDAVEVSRPSSGSFERLPLVVFDGLEPIATLRREGLMVVACLARAVRAMYGTDLTGPTVIVVGGEKRGISAAVRAACTARMSIPTKPGAPSLSLPHAAAIALAEAMRQRSLKSNPSTSLGASVQGPTSGSPSSSPRGSAGDRP